MSRNLCCNFPHGDAVILPLIFTSMAVVSTLMAFGLFPFMGKEDPDFGCVEYDMSNSRRFTCFPLLLNDETFWSDTVTNGDKGWANTVQIGAVFGIFACVMGVVAWALLLSATCLEIKQRRLMGIRVLLVVSSMFALLTLTAAAADVCELAMRNDGGGGNGGCDNKRFRLDYGGAAMMAGFIFHLFAAFATLGFMNSQPVRRENVPRGPVIEKQESSPMDIEGTA